MPSINANVGSSYKNNGFGINIFFVCWYQLQNGGEM